MNYDEMIHYMRNEGACIDWLKTLSQEDLRAAVSYQQKENRRYRTTECTMYDQMNG